MCRCSSPDVTNFSDLDLGIFLPLLLVDPPKLCHTGWKDMGSGHSVSLNRVQVRALAGPFKDTKPFGCLPRLLKPGNFDVVIGLPEHQLPTHPVSL